MLEFDFRVVARNINPRSEIQVVPAISSQVVDGTGEPLGFYGCGCRMIRCPWHFRK